MSSSEREHFDRWASDYDESVAATDGFPFAGYEAVLDLILERAQVEAPMAVLDLGTGTGAVAGRFLERGAAVWGTDFSTQMIEQARAKYPEGRFEIAELGGALPASFPERFDRIVSAYALHHLDLDGKVRLLADLAADRLREDGKLLVADVSFPTVDARELARDRFADRWDPEEFYWAADETRRALEPHGLRLEYVQVSFCAGVFLVS